MNKVDCEIINDVLPLYVEGIASNSTKKMVEEHIAQCPECSGKLKEMQKEINIPADDIIAPMSFLKKSLYRKKLSVIILSVMVSLGLAILGLIYLTAPIPLKYDESLIGIEKLDGGRVLVTVGEDADGYSVEGYKSDEDASKYVYHITLWNSLWNKYIKKGEERSFIINRNNDGTYHDVKAVYYYSENIGSEDLLIYGKDMHESGGVVTLPRLALTYYFIIALIISAASGVIFLLFKKSEKIRKAAKTAALFAVSYIISQVCIKGLNFSTYHLLKDLSGILLLTATVFGTLLIVGKLIGSKKRNFRV